MRVCVCLGVSTKACIKCFYAQPLSCRYYKFLINNLYVLALRSLLDKKLSLSIYSSSSLAQLCFSLCNVLFLFFGVFVFFFFSFLMLFVVCDLMVDDDNDVCVFDAIHHNVHLPWLLPGCLATSSILVGTIVPTLK